MSNFGIAMNKLTELLAELEKANRVLKEAEASESRARSDCCNARNIVNNLQKSIDAEMEKLKKEAAWNTDWHGRLNRGISVPG